MSNVILTEKQELFVQGIMNGLSQSDAYRAAYKTENMTGNTIWSNSCQLRRNTKVAQRIDFLNEEIAAQSKWSMAEAVDAMKWLLDKAKESINEQGVRQANSGAYLNAAKELNKISKHMPEDNKETSNSSDVAATIIVTDEESMKKFVDENHERVRLN